jgi:hypothetical protein
VDWLIRDFAPFGVDTYVQNWVLIAAAIIAVTGFYVWRTRV